MIQRFDEKAQSHTHLNLIPAQLVEAAIARGEGALSSTGALVVSTGQRTSRSSRDRFLVDEPSTADVIHWNDLNRAFDAERFDLLWERVEESMAGQERFVSQLHTGADSTHYLPVRVTTQKAWHALFAQNLFIRCEDYNPKSKGEWQLLWVSDFVCDPQRDDTHSDGCVIINFARRRVLLAGMSYAGEMKKAMFTVQNLLLPEKDVLPMHCAANVGDNEDITLLFGTTGSGKTALSAAPKRYLIGDDEHGWSKAGVFNLEAGCYAKTINLCRCSEPVIWDAIRFGAVAENVMLDSNRRIDCHDTAITENGRCSYPLSHLDQEAADYRGGQPRALIFLSCDLTGVLPPVALLSKEAAAYYFLSGYSAQPAEDGSGDQAVFSACFGVSFFPRHPVDYAELLIKRLEEFDCRVYLVNTGCHGGLEGVPERFEIGFSRQIIGAIQSGRLESVPCTRLAGLNLDIPTEIKGVDSRLLDPRRVWGDGDDYDRARQALIERFVRNFEQFDVPKAIVDAGPVRKALAQG